MQRSHSWWKKSLKQGVEPETLIDSHLIPAINYVGELFEQKKYFLPQLIASAETMEKAVEILEPLLEAKRRGEKLATIVMATVKGDIHDIGKNLVVLMLKNYGYDVIDLGKDVETDDILKTAIEERCQSNWIVGSDDYDNDGNEDGCRPGKRNGSKSKDCYWRSCGNAGFC